MVCKMDNNQLKYEFILACCKNLKCSECPFRSSKYPCWDYKKVYSDYDKEILKHLVLNDARFYKYRSLFVGINFK